MNDTELFSCGTNISINKLTTSAKARQTIQSIVYYSLLECEMCVVMDVTSLTVDEKHLYKAGVFSFDDGSQNTQLI